MTWINWISKHVFCNHRKQFQFKYKMRKKLGTKNVVPPPILFHSCKSTTWIKFLLIKVQPSFIAATSFFSVTIFSHKLFMFCLLLKFFLLLTKVAPHGPTKVNWDKELCLIFFLTIQPCFFLFLSWILDCKLPLRLVTYIWSWDHVFEGYLIIFSHVELRRWVWLQMSYFASQVTVDSQKIYTIIWWGGKAFIAAIWSRTSLIILLFLRAKNIF